LREEIYSVYNRDLEKIEKFMSSYEKEYRERFSLYSSESPKFDKKVADAVKVFTEYLGPSARTHIKQYILEKRFRKCMFELRKYYSASTGGTQNISSILNK
jgi:hypothetical protein